MIITVKFIPPLNEMYGKEECDIEFQDEITGNQLLQFLKKQYNHVTLDEKKIMLIVNKKYVTHEEVLKEKDEVSIVPIRSCCHW